MLRRLLLCYLAAGCTTWRAIPPAGLPPSTPVAYYDRVRVVRHDRSWTELREARVDRDSISGYGGNGRTRHSVGIPIGEVARIDSLEPDATRTVLLMLGIAVALIGAFVLALSGMGDCVYSSAPDVNCS